MSVLFQILLFLMPLIPCWVIYRYLETEKDMIRGTLLSSIRIRLYGVVVIYCAILVMSWIVVDAEFLGLNLSSAVSEWKYVLKDDQKTDRQRVFSQGKIYIKNGPGNIIHVGGVSEKGVKIGVLREKSGLRSDNIIYLPLALPEQKPELVAIGNVGNDRSEFDLNVFTIEVEKPKSPIIYGEIHLERAWPWKLLILVTLLPIAVVVLLARIGPLLASVTAVISQVPGWMSVLFNKIYIRLSSASAVYLLVYALVFIFFVGIPKHLGALDKIAIKQCGKISGEWYFELYHFYPEFGKYAVDYTGKSNVECNDEYGEIFVSGKFSEIHSLSEPYTDDASCFIGSQVGRGGQNWNTIVAGVTSNNIIAIYTNNEVETENRDMGLLIMPISKDITGKWSFYDFKEKQREESSLNYGDMKMYRPHKGVYPSCIKISEKRLSQIRRWY